MSNKFDSISSLQGCRPIVPRSVVQLQDLARILRVLILRMNRIKWSPNQPTHLPYRKILQQSILFLLFLKSTLNNSYHCSQLQTGFCSAFRSSYNDRQLGQRERNFVKKLKKICLLYVAQTKKNKHFHIN